MASVMTPVQPVKPRLWPLILAYLFIWGFLWVPGLVAVIYWGVRFAVEMEGAKLSPEELSLEFETGLMDFLGSAPFLAFSTVAIGSFMVVLAILAAVGSPVPARQRLRLGRGIHAGANVWIAGILFCFAVGHLSTVLLIWIYGGLSEQLHLLEATIAGASGGLLLWLTLGIGVAAPLGEEFMFRGYMQTRLVERFGAAWGITITSVGFGVMHLDLQHILAAVPVGVVLGIIALRTGSIMPCILAHAFNNLVYIATAESLPAEAMLEDLPAWMAGSLVASVVTGLWFFRATRPQPGQQGVQAGAPDTTAVSPP